MRHFFLAHGACVKLGPGDSRFEAARFLPPVRTLVSPSVPTRPISSRKNLALLALLYFAQGLPYGFQATALPVYLRGRGTSLAALGFVGVLSLPWLLKAIWAPWVDRFGSDRFGRRKSWIVPLQLGGVLCALAASAAAAQGRTSPLLVCIGVMNLLAATQDIAVDGWAIELLRGRSLGPGNALQVVGYKAGMLTGGGLLVWLSGTWGWSALFHWMAALWLAIGAVALFFPEPVPEGTSPEAEPARSSLTTLLRTLIEALRTPGAGTLLLLVATYKVGESMADAMFKPFLVDHGLSAGTIGLWMGTFGMAASVLGSLAGGYWVANAGAGRALRAAAVARCIPMVAQAALPYFPWSSGAALSVIGAEHLFGGALTTAMFAFMMSKVDRRIGATHYTALATIEVLGKSPGAWASGPLAERFGYGPLFVLAAGLSVGFAVLCARLAMTGSTPAVGLPSDPTTPAPAP